MLPAAAIARRLKTSAAAVAVHLSALRQKGEILGRGHVLKPTERVIVIGGANMDLKCRAAAPMVLGTSNPGTVAGAVGGVACNIARNLAKLGIATALMSVVGQDEFGERILRETRAAGVDVSLMLMSPRPTGTYVALLDADGDMTAAVSAMDATDELPGRIAARETAIRRRRMVVADCNLAQAPGPAERHLRRRQSAAGDRRRFHPQGDAPFRPAEGKRPIHLLALNRDEAGGAGRRQVHDERGLRAAAARCTE